MRKIIHISCIILCLCLLAGIAAGSVPEAYAVSEMTASDSCIDFIKSAEGFASKPYFDYTQYTVGYGTKCPTEKYFDYKANGISKSDAEALLREEIARIEYSINQKLIGKYSLAFSQHQFDALVSFSFNIGTGWLTYDSTLKEAILNNADAHEIVYAFGLYCTAGGKYLPGLVTRRLCEANMYLNGVYSQKKNDTYGYVYYDANGGTVTYRVQGFICDNTAVPAADAERSGDTFLGWYTDLTGGTEVTVLNRALTGKTLFARWQSSGSTNEPDSEATNVTVKVTGDIVNIRRGPGTNYGTVKQVYRNTVLSVSHVTHLTNMMWGKVPDGWICLDYTNYTDVSGGSGDSEPENSSPSDDDTLPEDTLTENDPDTDHEDAATDDSTNTQEPVSGIVNVTGFLNIRSGPGTAHPSVGFLFKNAKVTILEQKTVGTAIWGRMEKGWVCMDYIVTDRPAADETTTPGNWQEQETPPQQEPQPPAYKSEAVSITGKITADALRVRSGPGTANSIVGFYYQNDIVKVTEKTLVGSVYWGKTGKGWISMDYVSPDSSADEPASPAGSKAKTITADALRIRKDAGTNHKIVGFLYYGDKVMVSETKRVDGILWGKVAKGWISMDYVK